MAAVFSANSHVSSKSRTYHVSKIAVHDVTFYFGHIDSKPASLSPEEDESERYKPDTTCFTTSLPIVSQKILIRYKKPGGTSVYGMKFLDETAIIVDGFILKSGGISCVYFKSTTTELPENWIDRAGALTTFSEDNVPTYWYRFIEDRGISFAKAMHLECENIVCVTANRFFYPIQGR
jgi:hypothetical protein